jgi:purine-binding chemotaxis protein CheW
MVATGNQTLVEAGTKALAKTSELEQEVFELLVVFRLAGQQYGLLAGTVREIIRNRDTTRVPNVSAHVQGVINLRGRIIPVFNLRERLKMPKIDREHTASQTIIVVESDGADAGLLVDAVADVVKIVDSDINLAAQKVEVGVSQHFIHGTVIVSERLITLLKVEALLAS